MKKYPALSALALLVLSLTGMESSAQASPVTYTFNWVFDGQLPLPTAGSFTYDSSLASNPFSAFTVSWDGFTFNFTSLANTPTSPGATSNGCAAISTAVIFAFLTGTPECPGGTNNFTWVGNPGGPNPTFTLFDNSGANQILLRVASGTGVTGTPPTVSGLFTVGTPTTGVPEPSALLLALSGCAVLLGRRALVGRKSP